MKRKVFTAGLAASFISPAFGALVLTNGNFETSPPAGNSAAFAVTGWFESNTTASNFNDWTWNASSGAIRFTTTGVGVHTNLTTVAGLSNASGFIYQDLGIYTGDEATVALTGDALIRSDITQSFRGLSISFWQSPTAGVDGTLASGLAGATQLGATQTVSAIGIGAIGTGAIDLSGATIGNHIYVQIAAGTGLNEAFVDNLVLTTTPVPEPTASGLISAAFAAALIRRRRNATAR